MRSLDRSSLKKIDRVKAGGLRKTIIFTAGKFELHNFTILFIFSFCYHKRNCSKIIDKFYVETSANINLYIQISRQKNIRRTFLTFLGKRGTAVY